MKSLLLAAGLLEVVLAQQPIYGQCGGNGWTGGTTCVSGSCCTYSNDWYSQCLPGNCNGGGSGPTTLSTTTIKQTSTTAGGSTAPTGSFTNPVIYEDLADLDVFRVNDTYYYSASTMAYSPGAPILKSYDLVNWDYIGHSVPSLSAFGSKYDLKNGQRAYVKGIWASTMRYRQSNGRWYWIGCIEFSKSYIYTASAPEGPWSLAGSMNTCFYDAGLFFDDDGTAYIAYGNTKLSVSRLNLDTLSVSSTTQIYPGNGMPSIPMLEGSRMYKRAGTYYITSTNPPNEQWVLKSSSPTGPYTIKRIVSNMASPVSGGGTPHQGSFVDTPSGQWYYMPFIDAFPGGRSPVLAPLSWGSDGFPVIQTGSNGGLGASYPNPLPSRPMPSLLGTDSFSGTSLKPAWEWNHNPDTSRFSVSNGLTLSTATVTNDLFSARNTLTHRIHGPISTATILLDVSNMADGDRAGFAMFRDKSAWIGVKNDGGSFAVCMVNAINMDSNWNTESTGTTVASASISKGKIWLRIVADIRPGSGRTAVFSYSTDGSSFRTLGPSYTLGNAWQFFIGYRYGIFNYATKALGGSISVSSFTQTA